jgi:hypothetical protein
VFKVVLATLAGAAGVGAGVDVGAAFAGVRIGVLLACNGEFILALEAGLVGAGLIGVVPCVNAGADCATGGADIGAAFAGGAADVMTDIRESRSV